MENDLKNSRDDLHYHLTAALYNQKSKPFVEAEPSRPQKRKEAFDDQSAFTEMHDVISDLTLQAEQGRDNMTGTNGRGFDFQRKRYQLFNFLYRLGMQRRYEDVPHAHMGSFNWVFDPHLGFYEWLARGKGVYWITGKPGSGKSTLMKYIHNHQKTQTKLCDWNGGRPPVVTKYFFWVGPTIENRLTKVMLLLICGIRSMAARTKGPNRIL